jgi:stage III sporulation protein AF
MSQVYTQAFTWIKDIFLIIISLSFFQILIPDSKLEKYITFIFSIIVLAIITEPVAYLLGKK